MKKICVVTGSRAEYGLLRWLMEGIRQSTKLKLQIIATGMHLSPKFGKTVDIIKSDGFKIDHIVNMPLNSDTSEGIIKSMGVELDGFPDALNLLKPDIILVLGDRYEIFIAAIAAMVSNIPIAHLHGGESTEGMIDEAIRHCITKMSHLHFVAAKEYKKRVIQLGEKPVNVFDVGGLGVDNIYKLKLLTKEKLQESLDFKFLQKNLLVTFHPITLKPNDNELQISEVLQALSKLKDTGLIFTMPNADVGNDVIFHKIKEFCVNNKNTKCFTSLGQLKYFSCVKYMDGVIGNSSSGLLEVPSFKKGTINIGERQLGRLKAASIIDCDPKVESIVAAIDRLFSKEFQEALPATKNPYGNGGASESIVKILEKSSPSNILKKKFYNL